jgi:hypothetical protein
MTDIVKRLRDQKVTVSIYGPTNSEMKVTDPTELELEAADEIEKLRKSNDYLNLELEQLSMWKIDREQNEKLRAALIGVTSELETFVSIFKGYQGMTMNNASAAIRAAKAALGESDD